MSDRKADNMRKKYCDQESVFAHIWDNADADGLWDGDASTVAVEFNVSEDEAHEMLGALSDQGLIEKLYPGQYAIMKWRDRDGRPEEKVSP
jgi:hypothetical protein